MQGHSISGLYFLLNLQLDHGMAHAPNANTDKVLMQKRFSLIINIYRHRF
jgi:hypothetical protein